MRVLFGFVFLYFIYVTEISSIEVEYLETINFDSSSDDKVVITVPLTWGHVVTGCYLLTNAEDSIEFRPENNNTRNDISLRPLSMLSDCSIFMNGISKEHNGLWDLYTVNKDELQNSYEIHQTFKINIAVASDEASNTLIVHSVSIGEDVPLSILTTFGNTVTECQIQTNTGDLVTLIPESDNLREDIILRTSLLSGCGVDIKNVNKSHEGDWILTEKSINNESENEEQQLFKIEVHGEDEVPEADLTIEIDDLTFELGQTVSMTLGPEDVTYCRILNPNRVITHEGDKCELFIETVAWEHGGIWHAQILMPGRIETVDVPFTLTLMDVTGLESSTVVTSVDTRENTLRLSCSMKMAEDLKVCRFLSPSSQVFVAGEDIGEGRYAFALSSTLSDNEEYAVECGLDIELPLVAHDLGFWRCEVGSGESSHYGFLAVTDANLEYGPLVSVLPEATSVIGVIGEEINLSCNVPSSLLYCYYRAPNGTTFSVAPGGSTGGLRYTGKGLDAGDCSAVLLPDAVDSGRWSCHAGLRDSPSTQDVWAAFDLVAVRSPMAMRWYFLRNWVLVIEGHIYNNSAVDYCRFVRPDGLGFTANSAPSGYHFFGSQTTGVCGIQIVKPTHRDLGIWTVAATITGKSMEAVGNIDTSFSQPSASYYFINVIITILIFTLTLVVLSMMCGTKKSRRRTATQAAYLRESIRRSFRRPVSRSEVRGPKNEAPPPPYEASDVEAASPQSTQDATERIVNNTETETNHDIGTNSTQTEEQTVPRESRAEQVYYPRL